MAQTKTYRVQLVQSHINDRGQFCSDGKMVDTRLLQAKSLPELLTQIKALVVQAKFDCRAYVEVCGTRSRPSLSFREWIVANLLHITAHEG